jgi:hypothetical protein
VATSGAMSTDNQYIKYTISIAQNSQSISGNTSNVTVSVRFYRTNSGYETYGNGTVYCKINGSTYSAGVGPTQKITNSGIVLFSQTLNIGHNSDGSKVLTCSAWISHNRVSSSEQSYSQALTTIPRATTPVLPNPEVTMGGNLAIQLPRASSSFTHTLQHDFAAGDWTTFATGAGSSATLAVPMAWASRIPASTRTYGRIRCVTYNGSTYIGEATAQFFASVPASVAPTCRVTVTDPTGWEGVYGNPVSGLSKFAVTVTPTLAYGSPITSYATSANGTTYTAASFTTGVLTGSGNLAVSATVKDQRGRSGSASATKAVLAYTPPTITKLTVNRCNADGTDNNQGEYVRVTFTAAVTPLNNKNTASYTLRYKKTSEAAYTAVALDTLAGHYAVTDHAYVFPADSGNSYHVALSVADRHNTEQKTTSASTAFVLMHWKSDGTGMGIGKVAEESDLLDIGIETRFRGPVTGTAMGLAGLPLVADNDDLNDYIDPGVYGILTNVTARSLKNCPMDYAGRLEVWCSTGVSPSVIQYAYRLQRYTQYEGRGVWERHAYSNADGVWSFWDWRNASLEAYPVNSIYIAYSHTSPAELFGGTWTRMSNTFLWGCDPYGDIGATGGSRTHTLTEAEMPSHRHYGIYYSASGKSLVLNGGSANYQVTWTGEAGTSWNDELRTGFSGDGEAHNNMPPFTQVSIWRRIA